MTPRRKASGPRRAVQRTIFIVASLFVFYYLVIPTLARSRTSARLLQEVSPWLLALAVGLEIGALACYTILTRVTLPSEPRLHLFTIFRIQLATRSVTNLVPGGSAAGGTLGYRLLTEAGVAPTAAGFSLATVGLGSAVVLNLILWLSLLISIPMNGFRPLYVTAAIVGVLLLLFAGGLVYLLIEGRDHAERVLRGIFRRIPFVEEETAARFVHQMADRIQDLAQQPELVRRGVLWAAANWLLDAAALWVFLRAFGTSLNPINLIVAYGVAGVLAAIPITPGGLGVVETALPSLLVGFGAPAGEALSAVLAWRLVQFWMPIPLGGLSYASLKLGPLGRRRRLAAVRSLAAEAGAHATERVWDQQTGEFRTVRVDRGAPPASGAAEAVVDDGRAETDEPTADDGPTVEDEGSEDPDPGGYATSGWS
ncbi:MAG: YbhN family protein [Acidimicrobiales bacterium]